MRSFRALVYTAEAKFKIRAIALLYYLYDTRQAFFNEANKPGRLRKGEHQGQDLI